MLSALAGDWHFNSRLIAVSSGSQVRIVVANPLRWLLSIQFYGTGGYVYPGRIDPAPQPIGFTPTVANERFDFRYLDWGAIVGWDWYCYSPLSNVSLIVYEVLRRI
jgi:hypothetical protein